MGAIDDALLLLGKKRMLLQIHDSSFPATTDGDVGRGTPYSAAGERFARFVRSLGFTGIQFGPQGQTSRDNPSPYDSTAFSRSFLSLSFSRLAKDPLWGQLVDRRLLEEVTAASEDSHDVARTDHRHAFDAQGRLCDAAYARYTSRMANDTVMADAVQEFAQHSHAWLQPDALFDALAREHGTINWRSWAGPNAAVDRRLFCAALDDQASESRREALQIEHAEVLQQYALTQFLTHCQHQRFRDAACSVGLALYADLQIGFSLRDRWRLQPLFLQGYRLGAPPSRTNREGQPWGYPVLDPRQYNSASESAPVWGHDSGIAYLSARASKLFSEFDGVRIDHPQGLVCPWVYRADDANPLHAVQHGARLFASPALPDHPALAEHAIARSDQLADPAAAERHADEWVCDLDEAQVDRYSVLIEAIAQAARASGCDPQSIACETLSTQPYPLKRVMERFGLGRFRVTQKMDVTDPTDVYRTDNAQPADWVMMGNHDTRPIWARVREWDAAGELDDRATYLARRLKPGKQARAFRRELLADTGKLVNAFFADLLASSAQNVLVFFTDLLGIEETYNAPGTVGPENWSLRVPNDYAQRYRLDASSYRALNIPYAVGLALESTLTPTASPALVRAVMRTPHTGSGN